MSFRIMGSTVWLRWTRFALLTACIMFVETTPRRAAAEGPLVPSTATQSTASPAAIIPQPEASPGAATNTIAVNVGQSRTVQMPWRLTRVSVADPKVADVQALDPTTVMVLGTAPGATNLTAWGENNQIWSTRVRVGVDLERIQHDLKRLFPEANLEITYYPQGRTAAGGKAGDAGNGDRPSGAYVVTGTLARADQVDALHRLMESAGLGDCFVDLTKVPGLNQVQLKVRVAEVSRAAIRALGINALKTGDNFFGASLIGTSSGGPLNPINITPAKDALAGSDLPFIFPSDTNVSPNVTLLAGFPNSDLEFFIQALAENQYLHLLAEPTLVALSGQEASFLAGGEFPVPVVQNSNGANLSITIEWKEYGVRLKFLPTVLGENEIRMKVAPEVSNLSSIGAVEIEGFSIPSLATRRAETTLEMKSGQTFAIAGLMNQQQTARSSRVPYLGDVPILGNLFRTVRYEEEDTELVVLVKTELVDAVSATKKMPMPGDRHKTPSNWELYGLGQVEGRKDQAGQTAAKDQADLPEPTLEDLSGPDAWADYAAPAQVAP